MTLKSSSSSFSFLLKEWGKQVKETELVLVSYLEEGEETNGSGFRNPLPDIGKHRGKGGKKMLVHHETERERDKSLFKTLRHWLI